MPKTLTYAGSQFTANRIKHLHCVAFQKQFAIDNDLKDRFTQLRRDWIYAAEDAYYKDNVSIDVFRIMLYGC
jgi:hypothetical protein